MAFVACDRNEIGQPSPKGNATTAESTGRAIRPVVLGDKKNNPFSVQNMKIALDSLKNYVNESNDVVFKAKTLDEIELTTTDLYVRFLPLDSMQFKTLKSDSTLTLFDFPLDYAIKQSGDYYKDATVKTPFTWFYTTVKPGYTPPAGIKYEILQELFIAENSEYYSEETLSGGASQSRQVMRKRINELVDYNIFNALYAISFKLTGNEKELKVDAPDSATTLSSVNAKSSIMKVTIPNCTRYTINFGFRKVSWTSCDPYYYPDGCIKVNTPNGDIGLKGAKVRMWRWFTYADARTDANGYYYCSARFNSIWVGNSIDYHIIFDGQNAENNWTISRSIAGALCLWTNYYGAGSHDPNGFSMTFYTNSDYWGRCVLNNAIYDYCNITRNEGVTLPPNTLDIANKEDASFKSGAPLLNNHINWSLVYAYPNFWGVIGELYGYMLLGWSYPDLMLRYTKNLSDYNTINAVAWHELTHSSQLRRMISEKGLLWASDYWSANVYQQAANTFKDYDGDGKKDGKPYGNKGDERWQQIALSEGWANYREWYLAKKYLNYEIYPLQYNRTTNTYWQPIFDNYKDVSLTDYYGGMFKQLNDLGCSYTNLEKSLCVYSIGAYRDKLMSYYPNLSYSITNIVTNYE